MLRHTAVLAALLALTAAALPSGTFAQTITPEMPSYAHPSAGSAGSGEETIKGRIASFDGAYTLQLNDDRGFTDNVQLAPGTIIYPTGIRLAPGMSVTIYGVNRGASFAAREIDTPYDSYGAAPDYPYGPYYAYPVYAYPYWPYPYWPGFSIGIGFRPGFHRFR